MSTDCDKSTLWRCRNSEVELGERALVMGVLNVTPDSFSDGGRYFACSEAVEHALEMVREGADIIDVGGESARPGSKRVEPREQIRRVVPVIEQLSQGSDCLISVDTMSAEVAERAIESGAHIINDISALESDRAMSGVVASSGAGVVLMHMQGDPETMQEDPCYEDPVGEVTDYLLQRLEYALASGISFEQVVVDPGIGFGKRLEHNLELLRATGVLGTRLNRPVLIGGSRKSLLGEITGSPPEKRLSGSLGLALYAVLHGARIVRVHDVRETREILKVWSRLAGGINGNGS